MDGLMKQVKDTTSRPVLRYDYDAKGQTVASTDAGGTCVEYTHDPVGRVVAIRQGEKDLAQYTYASGNRIASMLYGNGVQTAYEYTPEFQVSRLHTRTADGTVLLDNQYTYDRSGNTIGCYGSEDHVAYRYDEMDRLVEARYAGYGTEQLTYDASGNRVSRIWNGQRTSYTYGTRNRLLSLIEEALQGEDGKQDISKEQADGRIIRYAYDAQGNLIREHKGEQTTTYAYDAFNRTSRVEQADGRVVQHGYDPEGLRIRLDNNGNVRHFVHDGWHVVNELDETERVQASYILGHEWLTQLDDQGHMDYYVNNIHGDVTHLTGQQGQILNAYTYDAFGNMLSAREQRGNPFRYAGEMQDALTGHYYLRARFYNPQIARFTQEDTYRGDGLNLYAYVANNPIRYVDPSGYMCEVKGDFIDRKPRMGDANYDGNLPAKSWTLAVDGDGAHMIERVNVRNRPELEHFDLKTTPRFYPAGSPENAGQAHIRLHAATKKAGIKLRGGNPGLTDDLLLKQYEVAYNDTELDGILGALRTPNSKLIIGDNLSPGEAYTKLLEWGTEYKKNNDNKE